MSKKAQKVSLMETLGAGLLPAHEFRSILAPYFDRAEQRDWKVVSYLRDDQVALRARYNNDGDLIEMKAGRGLHRDDIEAIAARVRAEANETRDCVCRCFVF
jgi:hypothetical protein